MATLEQQRAQLAFSHVQAVAKQDEAKRKKYASIVHTMPTLLRSAGLSQTLHFVASRKDSGQQQLLEHFSEQLQRVDKGIQNTAALLNAARGAKMGKYLRLTEETISCAVWYRRFVQGLLGIEAADANEASDV